MADFSDTLARFSLTETPTRKSGRSRRKASPRPVADAGVEDVSDLVRWRRRAAMVAVIGGMVFNAFLCMLNTRYFAVQDSLVMLGEFMFVSCALFVAADRRVGLYLPFTIFVSYMIVLFMLRRQVDPKAVRDILIPVAFYFAGLRMADRQLAHKLVLIAIGLVLVDGLFEYALLDIYLDYFNVLGYYIARGTVTLKESFGQTRGLFISGLRPEPRTILPFIGQHRVSSLFLEPVSAGNFGVIVYAWGLYAKGLRWRVWVMLGGFAVIAMADARFGLYTCLLMTVLYPFYHLIARPIWAMVPFLMLALLAIYGIESGTQGGADDIVGRLKVTAHLLTRLSSDVVIGSEVTDQFTSDSGLAYTLTQFGVFGFIGLWTIFIYAPGKTADAWRFHSMAIVYFLLLLIISNSGYSIKTGALFWFLLGTVNGVLPSPAGAAQSPPQAVSDSPGRKSAFI